MSDRIIVTFDKSQSMNDKEIFNDCLSVKE